MVKIAVAGGTGQVAREVLDALLANEKHDVMILSRHPRPATFPSTGWAIVSYDSHASLVSALTGVHTLLSFLQLLSDPEATVQKRLIDAAVEAGVKRFAPSEWGSKGTENMPWWTGKASMRSYLREINAERTVLPYTLIQPGLFLDYLAYPHKTSRHIDPLQTTFSFAHCRAVVVDGHEDAVLTLTSARDLARVVARAVESEDEWPEIGGICGNRLTVGEVIKIGESVRGQPFTVEKVEQEDLEMGELKASLKLEQKHHAVDEVQAKEMLKMVQIGMLLSTVKGAWDVSDEFNGLVPWYEFEGAEEFLGRVWKDKE